MNIENNMISMPSPNKIPFLKILTIFPYFAIYSEPLCATYASFGGGGSQITVWQTYQKLKLINLQTC